MSEGSGSLVDQVARNMAAVALKTGYGYYPEGKSEQDCKKKAEAEGGYVWDEHAQACWKLFGKEVKITPTEHDIQEGFEIVNFNFHTGSNAAPVPKGSSLPGPTQGFGSPGWHSDQGQTGVIS